jgi:hypothetical protein
MSRMPRVPAWHRGRQASEQLRLGLCRVRGSRLITPHAVIQRCPRCHGHHLLRQICPHRPHVPVLAPLLGHAVPLNDNSWHRRPALRHELHGGIVIRRRGTPSTVSQRVLSCSLPQLLCSGVDRCLGLGPQTTDRWYGSPRPPASMRGMRMGPTYVLTSGRSSSATGAGCCSLAIR